jgi:hypothetical protein
MAYVERNESFDEMMGECYSDVTIGYLTFSAADILYNCDPIAYRCDVSDYEDSNSDD